MKCKTLQISRKWVSVFPTRIPTLKFLRSNSIVWSVLCWTWLKLSTGLSWKTWLSSGNHRGKILFNSKWLADSRIWILFRYVDRVANSLQQNLRLADKMQSHSKASAEKRRTTAAEQARQQPLLKRLIERTKELQGEIEKNISKKYNNRPVHITGGVAAL